MKAFRHGMCGVKRQTVFLRQLLTVGFDTIDDGIVIGSMHVQQLIQPLFDGKAFLVAHAKGSWSGRDVALDDGWVVEAL